MQAERKEGTDATGLGIIHVWVFSDEDGVKMCIHLYFHHGVDLVDDESAAAEDV